MEKQRVGGIMILLSLAAALYMGVFPFIEILIYDFSVVMLLFMLLFMIPAVLILMGGIRVIYHKRYGSILAFVGNCILLILWLGATIKNSILLLGFSNLESLVFLSAGVIGVIICFKNRKVEPSMVKPRKGGLLMLIVGGYLFFWGLNEIWKASFQAYYYSGFNIHLLWNIIYMFSVSASLCAAILLLNEKAEGGLLGFIGGMIALGCLLGRFIYFLIGLASGFEFFHAVITTLTNESILLLLVALVIVGSRIKAR